METFSHTSDTSDEAKEGGPIYDLGESISFGRFLSESLPWEKWSSFSHNRYLEEVEKYSKPGSVAQKKAYFEAHYKRIAAKKAAEAALLEQENVAANNVSKLESEDPDSELAGLNSNVAIYAPQETETQFPNTEVGYMAIANGNKDSELAGLNSNVTIDAPQETETQNLNTEESFIVSATECNSNIEMDAGNHIKVTEMGLCRIHETEPPLKENLAPKQEELASATKIKPMVSSSKSSLNSRISKHLSSPVKPTTPIHLRKENNATPNRKSSAILDLTDKIPKSLHMSITFASFRAGETNKLSSPIIQKTEKSRFAGCSSKTSKDCSIPLRTPTKASVNGLPKVPSVTPQSENIRTRTTLAGSSSKRYKDCSTPLRTPTMASMNGLPKVSSVTPQSENRRTRTALDQRVFGNRKVDAKWQSLSVDRLKTSITLGKRGQSPIASSSFNFKTDERTLRRKEKLEEKFNAKEVQKGQIQTKSKDEAENELKKLRQSLGFKARPMPDFNRKTESPKNQMKKIPLTRPRSPKLGRISNSSVVQETASLPPRRPSIKSDGAKHAAEKHHRTPTHPLNLLPKKNTQENASPNIQH